MTVVKGPIEATPAPPRKYQFRVHRHAVCRACGKGTYFDHAITELVLTEEAAAAEKDHGRRGDMPTHVRVAVCAVCHARIVELGKSARNSGGHVLWHELAAFPAQKSSVLVPDEVPKDYADDYREAHSVLGASSRASAALSRRCLERLLRGPGGLGDEGDLAKLIKRAIPSLPPALAESVDAIRAIGNFAAHPGKSITTGEIIDVEPGEAEWSLEVLLELFNHYFVQPAQLAAKRSALNQKLAEADRGPLKGRPASEPDVEPG